MINLLAVDLGIKKIKLPVAEISGIRKGKTILITAGLDGDEFCGIEACYELIREFRQRKFKGKLLILPIVNLPGFESNQSLNPLDGKYPKLVGFGKKTGSATERLMDRIYNHYVFNSDIWLDLHSGAMTEHLNPFIYTYQSKNKKVNTLIKSIIKHLPVKKIIYDKDRLWLHHEILDKKGITYLLSEAGYSGLRERDDIEYHLKFVKQVMSVLAMIEQKQTPLKPAKIYQQIRSYKASISGLWYPSKLFSSKINKDQKIGEIRSYQGKLIKEIFSKQEGEYLWGKLALYCQKGDVLAELAEKLVRI